MKQDRTKAVRKYNLEDVSSGGVAVEGFVQEPNDASDVPYFLEMAEENLDLGNIFTAGLFLGAAAAVCKAPGPERDRLDDLIRRGHGDAP